MNYAKTKKPKVKPGPMLKPNTGSGKRKCFHLIGQENHLLLLYLITRDSDSEGFPNLTSDVDSGCSIYMTGDVESFFS